MLKKLFSRRRDERGAVLALAAGSLVVVMISAALAIDLGRLSQEKRTDQKIADLAALDASRYLPVPGATKDAAQRSAINNGFTPTSTVYGMSGPDDGVLYVCLGTMSGVNFVPGGGGGCNVGNAVRVRVQSAFSTAFPFVSGPDGVAANAIGGIQGNAGFSIGSSLLNLSTSSSALLNPIIGQWLGSSINLSLVSWQGLAAGEVTLEALRTELAEMGFAVGGVDELLDADLTLAQLFQATANALTTNGDTANAALFLGPVGLIAKATSTATLKLGEFITVAQGAEDTALETDFNIFQLVTGGAQVANGTNTVSIPNTTITVPNTASTAITVKVTEGPKIYIGPEGGSVETGQVEISVTPTVNLVNLLGLVTVTGSVPANVTAAGAKGTLTDIQCTDPGKGITVEVDPKALSGSVAVASDNLIVRALGINILRISTTSVTPEVNGAASSHFFPYPGQFSPPGTYSHHFGSQPVGLQSLTNLSAGNVTVLNALTLNTVLGLLGLNQAQLVASIINSLKPILGGVDTNILTPLLTALGLDVGSADVTALGDELKCGTPGLLQ
jgi:uncharacterized membrane protein